MHTAQQPKSSKSTKQRPTHNLSENINNSSFTIQQYNNFINFDSFKNNIHIAQNHQNIVNPSESHEKPNNFEKNYLKTHLQVPKTKDFPLKTSPSPIKKELKSKKMTNYSTDRYVVDRPIQLNTSNNNKPNNINLNNKRDSSNLFKKLQSKISKNALDSKQMGRSFENIKNNNNPLNSQISKENLNNKISQISKKLMRKTNEKSFANSFAYINKLYHKSLRVSFRNIGN